MSKVRSNLNRSSPNTGAFSAGLAALQVHDPKAGVKAMARDLAVAKSVHFRRKERLHESSQQPQWPPSEHDPERTKCCSSPLHAEMGFAKAENWIKPRGSVTKLSTPTDLSSRVLKTLKVGTKYHSGTISRGVWNGLARKSPWEGSELPEPAVDFETPAITTGKT